MDKKTLGQYFTISVLPSVRMRVEYFFNVNICGFNLDSREFKCYFLTSDSKVVQSGCRSNVGTQVSLDRV